MKKWFAIILACILTFSSLPMGSAARQEPEQARDIWDIIAEIEDSAVPEGCEISVAERTASYNASVDEIIEAVMASPDYVPGSLERHGNFFFWLDTEGDPNGYSPSLRARQRSSEIPGADPEDYAAIESVSYAAKGGSAGSMDVAAFQPYIGIDGSFTAQYENRCNAIAQKTGGTGTTYKTSQANINNIGLALSTCGVVIYDSHGTTDYDNGSWSNPDYTTYANCSYLCLTSGTGITAEDKQSATGDFGTYYHAFQSGSTWCVDGTAMANHMTSDSPNGILWMAICLGMATDKLEAPMRAHGVEVVYGYSQSVTFSGDYKYEAFFWDHMCNDYTVGESASYMKTKSNCNWDPAYSSYTYSQAVANHVAFPIFVSDEDTYPGHGSVDVVQTVNSEWTLFAQFVLTAVSSNEDWGTVSVNGRKITAYPAEGYYAEGYEILSGNATVTRDGNVFIVDAEDDCSIQIIFAPKTPAVVQFSVPDGVTCEPINSYVNDEIVLPTPTGAPTGDAHDYRFLGWTTEAIDEDTTVLPDFMKAGTKLTIGEQTTTLFALYTYFIAEDGMEAGEFTKVGPDHTSWAGEYVITYEGVTALDASGTITGTSLGGSRAAVSLQEAGAILAGDTLNNVPDSLIYVVEPSENGTYTIRMKEHEIYLALTSNSNALNTATGTNKNTARWNLSVDENGPIVASAAYPDRHLQYNGTSKLFRCYVTTQKPITLYAGADGESWYTTAPKAKIICEEHSFGDWQVVKEPTCTVDGQKARTCTVCGTRETEALPALGHDYQESVVDPTCTENGYTAHVCSRCGDIYSDNEVPALGHDYQDTVVEPTCTENGYTVHTCARCGNVAQDTEVPALGHDYQDTDVEPTCTEGGYTVHTCARCGDVVQDSEVPALGHDYQDTVFEPTCTEGGYTIHTCSRCGTVVQDSETAALGHNWDEGEVTLEPTETEPGVKTYTCLRCGETRTEELPAVPHEHNYGEPVWTWNEDLTAATASFTCECGDVQTLNAEITEEITIIPTEQEEGEKVVTAKVLFNEVEYTDVKTIILKKVGDHDCPCADFTDMPEYGTVEHDAIDWAFTHDPQITKGMSDTSFGPELTVTRGQAVTFLWRAAGCPEPTVTEHSFTDVKATAFYYEAMLWAVEKGITTGATTTTFSPNKTCTIEQILTFIYRYMGEPEIVNTENPWSDVNGSGFSFKAIMWAVENGIAAPKSETEFGRKDDCTRVAIVTYLYRIMTGEGLVE